MSVPTALLLGAPGRGELVELAELDACAAALAGWRLLAVTRRPDEAAARGLTPVAPDAVTAAVPAVLGAEAIVVAGGSLGELASPGVARRAGSMAHLLVVAAASLPARTLALVGVDALAPVGPVGAGVERTLVRRADLLVLRDRASAAALASLGAPGPFRVGADPTWSLLEPPTPTQASRGDAVVVVPPARALADEAAGASLAWLAEGLAMAQAAGLQIALQPWDGPPRRSRRRRLEAEVLVHLEARLGGRLGVLPRPRSLTEASEAMAGAASVVACRFHAVVAAAAAGVPVVAVGLERGVSELARRLGQAAVPAGADPGSLADLVVRSATAAGPGVEMVKEEIVRAEEGFRLLRVLLGGRTGAEPEPLGALPLESGLPLGTTPPLEPGPR